MTRGETWGLLAALAALLVIYRVGLRTSWPVAFLVIALFTSGFLLIVLGGAR